MHVSFLASLAAVCMAKDKVFGTTGTTARVLGNSGKIILDNGDNAVRIEMSDVAERDLNGGVVGDHWFNGFSSQEFEFTDPAEVDLHGSKAMGVNFSSTVLDGAAPLLVEMYLMQNATLIEEGGEALQTFPGSLKFSYNIASWPFCSAGGTGTSLCKKGGEEQVGAFLDFSIIIKAENTKSKKTDDDDDDKTKSDDDKSSRPEVTYAADDKAAKKAAKSLRMAEGGSTLLLASKYRAGSTWREMPAGYPVVQQKNKKTTITFRFERFDGTLYYDPVLNFQEIDPSSADWGLVGGLSAAGALVLGAFAVTFRRFRARAGANDAPPAEGVAPYTVSQSGDGVPATSADVARL